MLRWLPMALFMLQLCVLCTTGLLTAACSNLQKPRRTSSGVVVWLPLE